MPVILTSRSGSYRDSSPSNPLSPSSLQLTTCCEPFSVRFSRGSQSGRCLLSPCVQGSNSVSAVAAASRGERNFRAGKMRRLESVILPLVLLDLLQLAPQVYVQEEGRSIRQGYLPPLESCARVPVAAGDEESGSLL